MTDEVILSAKEVADIKAEAKAEGRAEERARVKAIVRSDAANGKRKAAVAIALDTDLDAAQASAVLASSPTDVASSGFGGRDPFAEMTARRGSCGSPWGAVHDQTAETLGLRKAH